MQLMNEPNTANATDPSKRRDERGLHQSAPFVQIAPAWNPSCHSLTDYPSRCGPEPGSLPNGNIGFHHLVKEGTNIAVPESTRLQHLYSHLQIVDNSRGIQTRVQHLTTLQNDQHNSIVSDFSQLPFILFNQHQFQLIYFNFIQDSARNMPPRGKASGPPRINTTSHTMGRRTCQARIEKGMNLEHAEHLRMAA